MSKPDGRRARRTATVNGNNSNAVSAALLATLPVSTQGFANLLTNYTRRVRGWFKQPRFCGEELDLRKVCTVLLMSAQRFSSSVEGRRGLGCSPDCLKSLLAKPLVGASSLHVLCSGLSCSVTRLRQKAGSGCKSCDEDGVAFAGF